MGMRSDFRKSTSTTLANSPSFPEAARRTIGVSSWHRLRNWLRRSAARSVNNYFHKIISKHQKGYSNQVGGGHHYYNKMFSQTFDRRGDPRVADGEESAGRGPRSEPVPRRESLDQRHKVRLQVRCAVLLSHVTQALDRLYNTDSVSNF